MTSGAAQRERLVTVLGPAVAAAGCDLEEVTVSPAGKRKIARVVVASDAGVTLDEVAAVILAVTEVLDARDTELFGASPYVLEVSSPGVDRPLTEPRHWRRAVGRSRTRTTSSTTWRRRTREHRHLGAQTDRAGEGDLLRHGRPGDRDRPAHGVQAHRGPAAGRPRGG